MAADQWLIDMDRESTRCAALRAATAQQDAQSTVEEGRESDPGEESTEQSAVEEEEDDNMDDLSTYGPTAEEHRGHVRDLGAKTGSSNTIQQYTRLVNEYKEFARVIFKDESFTVDNVLKFLQFQAHREHRNQAEPDDDPEEPEEPEENGDQVQQPKKKRQRRNKKSTSTKTTKYKFNIEDYKKVMDHIKNDIEGIDPESWAPWNRLKSIDKYRSAVIWGAPEDISTAIRLSRSIKELRENVNTRSKMKMVMNDAEDLNKVTEKFRYPELYVKAEEWLWDEYKNKSNWKYLARSMRDRYTLLMTVQTCTRHENGTA